MRIQHYADHANMCCTGACGMHCYDGIRVRPFSAHFSTSVDSSVRAVTRKGISCDVIIRQDSFGIPVLRHQTKRTCFPGRVCQRPTGSADGCNENSRSGTHLRLPATKAFSTSLCVLWTFAAASARAGRYRRDLVRFSSILRGVNAYIETHQPAPEFVALSLNHGSHHSMYVFIYSTSAFRTTSPKNSIFSCSRHVSAIIKRLSFSRLSMKCCHSMSR